MRNFFGGLINTTLGFVGLGAFGPNPLGNAQSELASAVSKMNGITQISSLQSAQGLQTNIKNLAKYLSGKQSQTD